jgi:UDP-3-O-[3-hydroxymyristoyl] glucosamine N-acyltransferase
MRRWLREVADAVQGRLIGEGHTEITGVSSLESASQNDLVFVDDEKHFAAALKSRAGAIIAGEFAASQNPGRPLLISDHPKLAFARAAQMFGEEPQSSQGEQASVHPTAVVHPSVILGSRVRVDARAVIGENTSLQDRTRIGAGTVIGKAVTIGRDSTIYPNVTIYAGTTVGERVIVHAGAVLGSDGFGYVRDRKTGHYEKFPQVGRLVIEDDVEIGANATVDRGALDETRIHRGAKIDNLVHVGHNCDIGEDVVIAAQTGLSGSIVIEKGAVLGGQVGIGEHARIGEGVMLGGQGGVLPNKILRGRGLAFWGTPAQPLGQYLKQLATLARLARKAGG